MNLCNTHAQAHRLVILIQLPGLQPGLILYILELVREYFYPAVATAAVLQLCLACWDTSLDLLAILFQNEPTWNRRDKMTPLASIQ